MNSMHEWNAKMRHDMLVKQGEQRAEWMRGVTPPQPALTSLRKTLTTYVQKILSPRRESEAEIGTVVPYFAANTPKQKAVAPRRK